MKRTISLALVLAILIVFADLSAAQDTTKNGKVVLPEGITEEMLAPPPMPQFMLKKSATPLLIDEMVEQARAAEIKAGAKHQLVAKEPQTQASKPTN